MQVQPAGGGLYGLGIFGAWVYFWQQADAFWEYVLAVFQGLFWPAFMVYDVFVARPVSPGRSRRGRLSVRAGGG